jgi:CRISPR-associated protein Cas2
MAFNATNEQGYRVQTIGTNRRVPVDWAGMQLVAFQPPRAVGESSVQVGRN